MNKAELAAEIGPCNTQEKYVNKAELAAEIASRTNNTKKAVKRNLGNIN